MSSPTVSVLTPVLNPDPGYFRGMVQSVLGQTFGDWEHVIVEDPPTKPECEGVAERVVAEAADPRIRLLRNEERTSLVRQRNRAIDEARGELLAWIDADDLCEPDRLLLQVDYLTEHPRVDLVGSCVTIVNGAGERIGQRDYPLDHQSIARTMPLRNPITQSSVMVRKESVLKVGAYDYDQRLGCEDYDLWCRMLLDGAQFANLREQIVRYRIQRDQIKSTSVREQLLGTLDIKRRHFGSNPDPRGAFRRWAEWALLFAPPALVYRLFLRTHVKQQPRSARSRPKPS